MAVQSNNYSVHAMCLLILQTLNEHPYRFFSERGLLNKDLVLYIVLIAGNRKSVIFCAY